MTLAHAVASHTLIPAQNPCDGDLCLGCWTADGESVLWPCGPLLDVAAVEPIGGGWRLTARTAGA
ncbi:hypothetical protein [Kitasatospora sp. NPDC058046]|uniref:hypothetical protein n=1 Tax=Kitasatospora sp. NPDC058046 TaxID=3346312 RepID=UPI0036DCDEF1